MNPHRLAIVFGCFLAAILAATGWASLQVPIFETPREVVTHPWFIATLVDAYLAFTAFWLWVAYKLRTWPARIAWLLAIYLTGNMAMAVFVLWQVWTLPRDAGLDALLTRRA